ncbi:MAG: AAA family ATPase, partial [Hyphomicrobiales bacterium]|nr:AAA family ATPase [Hyphomicrobiales bacterium]
KRAHPTPLIAREDEVDRLNRCWEDAKTGKGQVVLISGEAGIGKSRLTRHFEDLIEAESKDCLITKLYCSNNYQNSTLYPIINQITQDSGIDQNDLNDVKIEKLENYLNRHSKKSNDEIVLVMELLSIDFDKEYQPLQLSPDARKLQTFQILEQLICESTSDKPALLIIEDLHWGDPTTLELLDRIVINQVHDLPLLIVLTFRTEFVSSWPDEHYITDIKVKRLSPADSEKLLGEMTLNAPLPVDVIKKIIERSDRIPLFLEEVYKATSENITLNKEGDRFDAMRSSSATDVPSSLAGSLMERLDRLGPVKDVAQVAAAVGHVFSADILEHIVPLGPAELRQALDQLIMSEIILLRKVGTDMTYVFKHALLQDAAYSSLLRGERRKLHTRIAKILEEKYPETANREPERLADHCSKGGLAEPAIDYWQRAGERARERSANSEAIRHLSSGLDLLKTLPGDKINAEREIDLRTSLALALTALHGGGAAEVKENYSRARQLSQLDSDSSKHFTIMIGSWLNSFIGAELYDAQSLSNELLELAARKDDVSYLVEAKRVRGMTLFYVGDFAGAHAMIESALELHDPEHHRLHAVRYGLDPLVCCDAYLAYALLFLGYTEQAIHKSEEAVKAAQVLEHPYTYAFSLAFAAFVHQNLEQRSETRQLAEKVMRVSDEHEFQFWGKQQLFVRSWAEVKPGGAQAGPVDMRKAMDAFLDSGSTIGSTRFLSLMAEVHINSGQIDEGRSMLERALQTANESGEKFYLAEIYRLEAELHLARQGKPDVAEICSCLRHSLDVSESQNAVFWQLRTARSVAGLGYRFCQEDGLSDRILRTCNDAGQGCHATEAISASRALLDRLC